MAPKELWNSDHASRFRKSNRLQNGKGPKRNSHFDTKRRLERPGEIDGKLCLPLHGRVFHAKNTAPSPNHKRSRVTTLLDLKIQLGLNSGTFEGHTPLCPLQRPKRKEAVLGHGTKRRFVRCLLHPHPINTPENRTRRVRALFELPSRLPKKVLPKVR